MSITRSSLLIFSLIFLVPAGNAANIHGTIYEWSTFEPLDNALIEVNSTPVQLRVATSGIYSFNLPPGEYCIKTSYFENGNLQYYNEDNITVTDVEGDFVFDILLFPPDYEIREMPDDDIANISLDFQDTPFRFGWTYSAVALLLLIAITSAIYLYGKKNHTEELPEIITELPDDLKELVTIIKSSGGRLTQRELRNKVKCSEAKVSLMVSDLEDRGLVKKIKKGRGNIILLSDAAQK